MAKAYIGLGDWEEIPRGATFGARVVLSETSPGARGARRFTVRCECGGVDRLQIGALKKLAGTKAGGRCKRCAKRWMSRRIDDGNEEATKRTTPVHFG